MKKEQGQKLENQGQAVVKEAIEKTCVSCGCSFETTNPQENECLSCKIIREMHLPEDTIVNHNVLSIYIAGKFDREHGVDPVYLKVAEGVALLDRKRNEEQLCSNITFFGEKKVDEIENYVKSFLSGKRCKDKYDALVMVKVTSLSGFMVFGISWSDRMINKMAGHSKQFVKNYAVSLAIKWYYGSGNGK